MSTILCRFALLLAAALVALSCGPASTTPPTNATTDAPRAASTPQSADAAYTRPPSPRMSAPDGGVVALLLTRVEGTGIGTVRARPIDPKTLVDVEGFTPIELLHHYRAALGPDGRTLAVFAWPSGSSNIGGELRLIDSRMWTDVDTGVRLGDIAVWLGWTADAKQLVWIRPIGAGDDYLVSAYDVGSGSVRDVARLPPGFQPADARLLDSQLVVVGARNVRNVAMEHAAVAFVDLGGARATSLLSLPGLRLGQFKDDAPGAYPNRMIEPALVWDQVRGRLLLVDAEADILRIVDLVKGTESGPLRVRRSAAASAGGRAAKMVSATSKVAVLSGDGRWLYVTGIRSDLSAWGGSEQVTPLFLQRIDVAALTEVARVEIGSEKVWLSPDGERVILVTSGYEQVASGPATRVGQELHLLDARTLREITSLPVEGETVVLATGEAGRVAYVASRKPFVDGSSSSRLRSLDVQSGSWLASRDVDRHLAELLDLRKAGAAP